MAWQIATASASAAWSGRGSLGEAEQRLDHARHLVLLRAPAAADSALDLLRRVARARQPALAGSQQHHAARLPDGERGAHVLAEVQLLERHRIGRVLVEQRVDGGVDLRQAPLGREFRGGRDHAAVQRHEPAAAPRDDAVAGVGEAGIDAEDDHGP